MFSPLIIGYLFLGGLSGGLCVIAAISGLTIPTTYLRGGLAPQQRQIMTWSFVACTEGLLLSALLLLADSGNVSAVKFLFTAARPNYLVVGTWLIIAGMMLSFAQALLWRGHAAPRNVWPTRFLLAVEALVGIAVVLYTGLFLSNMIAVPLWHTPWLVALFAASSLSCAVAAFAALVHSNGLSALFGQWQHVLLKADAFFLISEAVCGVAFIASAFSSDAGISVAQVAQASANRLLFGDVSLVWWLGFAGVGVAMPLALESLALRHWHASAQGFEPTSFLPIMLAACACIGGLSMRYCIVIAGMHPPLSF